MNKQSWNYLAKKVNISVLGNDTRTWWTLPRSNTRYPNFALKLILPLVEHSISEVTNRLLLADQKSTDMEAIRIGYYWISDDECI